MSTWPDPRSISVGFAFEQSLRDSSPTFEYLSPGDDDDPGPVLAGVRWQRGRVGDAPETAPTQIAFALRDDEGEFSPRNVSGPRYGTLRSGVPVRLTLDAGSGPVTVATAQVPSWTPRWDGEDEDEQRSINGRIPINAFGVLSLIGRDQDSKSALRLAITGEGAARVPVGYWPMENGTLGNEISPAVPGEAADGVLATADGPVGSAGAAQFTTAAGGDLRLPVAPYQRDSGTVTLAFQLRCDRSAVDAGHDVHGEFRLVYDNGFSNKFEWDSGPGGTTITLDSTATRTVDVCDGAWHRIECVLQASTAFVKCDTSNFGNGATSDSRAMIEDLRSFLCFDTTTVESVPFELCHVAVYDQWLGTTMYPIFSATGGYDGEEADARIDRLLTQAGWPQDVTAGTTATMGPQTPGTVHALIREAEDADEGVLPERRDGTVGFDPLEARYNLTPALELAWSDIPGADPFDDDRDLYNVITVTDAEGNYAIEQQATGPVGTATEGPRPLPVTRNLADSDQLRHHAGWILRKGTVDQPRYVVVLDLIAEPSLVDDWLACDIGSRITVTGNPAWHTGPNDLDLIVEGERGELDATKGIVELHCQPYEPYNVRELAEETAPDLDPAMGRWAEEELCATREAIDDDDTSFDFDPISPWTVDADDVDTDNHIPLIVDLDGERMQVTAVATTPATFVAAGAADHDDNAAVTPADYAGGATGDWVFVVARLRGFAGGLSIADANYDYTLLRQQGRLYLWAALRTADAPAPTVTPSGAAAGATVSAVMFGFANMPSTLTDLTTAVYRSDGRSNDDAPLQQNIQVPLLRSGVRDNRLVLVVAGKSDDWTSVAVPTGFTEAVDVSTTTGDDQGLYVAYRIDTTPTPAGGWSLEVTGGATAAEDAMVVGLASGYQTLTVTRSVNGAAKSHGAGVSVKIVDPQIWAL